MRSDSKAVLAGLALISCVAQQQRGRPLYPAAEVPRGLDEVSALTGYVRWVDGTDVSSHGSSFEVLPGCHIIGTPSGWGRVEAGSGGVIVTTGRLVFALSMRAGYQYRIDVHPRVMGGPTGSVVVDATERDRAGHATSVFLPASPDEIQACKNAEAPAK